MEIFKRCACGAILINNTSGYQEWRKGDPIVVKNAIEQTPEGCLTDGIDYLPLVLTCDMCTELPLQISGF